MLDIHIERINPTLAERYLQKNISNRRLRETVVKTYAKDMKEGRWELTHQGIAFDSNGELLDGQHRLKAIIEAGVSIQMLVARGVSSRINLDNHAKRILSDSTGYSKYKVAIARIILDRGAGGNNARASNSELNEFILKHYEHLDFAEKALSSALPGVRLSAVKAAFFIASYVEDPVRLTEFGEVLLTGRYTDYIEDSAAIRLREWLTTKENSSRLYASQRLTYLRTEKAIMMFCKREEVKRLVTPESSIYIVPEISN